MSDNKTRFIRKNGRIIPIRAKNGQGAPAPKQKAAANNSKKKLGKELLKYNNKGGQHRAMYEAHKPGSFAVEGALSAAIGAHFGGKAGAATTLGAALLGGAVGSLLKTGSKSKANYHKRKSEQAGKKASSIVKRMKKLGMSNRAIDKTQEGGWEE